MAFLDNSADIILDAVLTQVGRRRLAQATRIGGNNARIAFFALGDDEINYTQYNLNSPSGSNYADLEILQTPILEAFSMGNVGINHGLLSMADTNILYMPVTKVNTLASAGFPALQPYNGIYYMPVNQDTADSLKGSEGLANQQIGRVFGPGSAANFIAVESGLDTTDLTKDSSNRSTYLVSKGVVNSEFMVAIDDRLLGSAYTCAAGSFKNNTNNNNDERLGFVLSQAPIYNTGDKTIGVSNYSVFSSRAIPNNVVQAATGTPSSYSVIAGPGGAVTAFNFSVKSSLQNTAAGARDILYSQIGIVAANSSTLFSSGGRYYDYIDTMTYVYGTTNGYIISIPVRIIRLTNAP